MNFEQFNLILKNNEKTSNIDILKILVEHL